MKRLFTIFSVMIIACFALSSIVSAENRVNVKTSDENREKRELLARREAHKERIALREQEMRVREKERREAQKELLAVREQEMRVREEAHKARIASRELELRAREKERKEQHALREQGLNERKEFLASNNMMVQSEHKRNISKEFSVGSTPTLNVSNSFGKINIVEGAGDKIIFNITITGKGKNDNDAKKYSEAVDVNIVQTGNRVNAKTFLQSINCKNCGRSTDYEIIVPKNTKFILDNRHGDVSINNTTEFAEINIEFGKFYANELADADINIRHGESTINKSNNLKLKSSFSKHKLGVVGSVKGDFRHGGFDAKEIGSANVEAEFSTISIDRLKNSFISKNFRHGSLEINKVDNDFSNIEIDASFTKVQVDLTGNHNFKAALYTNFGSIDTGNLKFIEKSLDKKDAVVGVVGNVKDPSATVNISNRHGNIELD